METYKFWLILGIILLELLPAIFMKIATQGYVTPQPDYIIPKPFAEVQRGPDMNYNLAQLLESVKEILHDKALGNKVSIITGIIPGIPDMLAGNPTLLEELLAKIVGLCLDHLPANEYVKLEVSLRQMKGKEVLLDIDISDNGGWVSQSLLDEIFSVPEFAFGALKYNDPNWVIKESLAEINALTRSLGSILVGTSEPGKATRFGFLLKQEAVTGITEFAPIEISVSADSIGMLSPFRQPPLTGQKVLIVDDNPLNRVVVQKFLAAWKVETGIAENGYDAIRMVSEQHYDLVLMDLQMPELDGYSTTALIRSLPDEKGKNIPIVALTAYSGTEVHERVLAAGMDGMISKPLKPDSLYAHLASAVGKNDRKGWASISNTPNVTSNAANKMDGQGKKEVGAKQLLNFSSYLSYPAAEAEFLQELTTLTIAQLKRTGKDYIQALTENDAVRISAIYHRIKPTLEQLEFYSLEQLIIEGKNSTGLLTENLLSDHSAKVKNLVAQAITELEAARSSLGKEATE